MMLSEWLDSGLGLEYSGIASRLLSPEPEREKAETTALFSGGGAGAAGAARRLFPSPWQSPSEDFDGGNPQSGRAASPNIASDSESSSSADVGSDRPAAQQPQQPQPQPQPQQPQTEHRRPRLLAQMGSPQLLTPPPVQLRQTQSLSPERLTRPDDESISTVPSRATQDSGGTGLRRRFFLGKGRTASDAGDLEGSQPASRQRWSLCRGSPAGDGVAVAAAAAVAAVDAEVAAQVATQSDPDAGILLRGMLTSVRGWWRSSVSLRERFVEIEWSESARHHQLASRRLTKAGLPDPDLGKKRVFGGLLGAIAEPVSLPSHPDLFGWRLHLLPQICEDPLEFACRSESERSEWLRACAAAAEHQPPQGGLVRGRLWISIDSVTLLCEPSSGSRWQPAVVLEAAVVARFGNMSFRTVPRRLELVEDEGRVAFTSPADFGAAADMPITDDDPDLVVSIEVWLVDRGGRRCRRQARIDVPLFCFGRNKDRTFEIPVRNIEKPKGEGSQVGSVRFHGCFVQPMQSLVLPRPLRQGTAPHWKTVGDKPLREQLKEFEAFLKEFEIFSNRFMHHCDFGRDISFRLRHILEWHSPFLTIACMLSVTIVISFFHEYILPMGVFALLVGSASMHPRARELREQWSRWSQLFGQRCWRSSPSRSSAASADVLIPAQPHHPGTASLDSSPGNSDVAAGQRRVEQDHRAAPATREAPQPLERFENERRVMWGRFAANSLRPWWFDPPAWCDAQGIRAEPPKQEEAGVRYKWVVEVSPSTDSDGWQYARDFKRGVIWSSAFNHQCFVRRRRHRGQPMSPGCPGEVPSHCGSFCSNSGGALDSSSREVSAPRLSGALPPPPGLRTGFATSSQHGSKGTAPEFGLARTPFHDMYQQYLLRWSFLQRQIEYWMDWYERRKNLVFGVTASTHNLALVAIFVLLLAALVLPTRILVLCWIWGLFYEGFSQGRLIRTNHDTFIAALRDAAVTRWLHDEKRARAQAWGPSTLLDEVTDCGVELLVLRDWIRNEFYEGRPMVPLRALQRCSTLRDLAQQVTWTSDRFARRRQRPPVWWRSTFRNLIDHVPSDVTLFQPLTCQGLGDGSHSGDGGA